MLERLPNLPNYFAIGIATFSFVISLILPDSLYM